MDEFPLSIDIRSHLLRDKQQVSHGLNLVLRLENPAKMPCLLLDILKRLPQVEQALTELNFVHFARFLPTRSGSALQVITEFDGPLEPYVMDFAVAVGELFSTILSYVADHPPLPVKDHPDEFWRFVKLNNRVQILGKPLPEAVDYPLFSAYPKLTVLDIVGPRKQLPPPVADGAHASIHRSDVQGNILEGYRAQFARHFVLRVVDPAKARTWFSLLPITPATDWKGNRPETTLNVGFTFDGLKALLIKKEWLERFPQAFRDGPHHKDRAQANGDAGESSPVRWRVGGASAHAMLSLYGFGDAKPAFDARIAELEKSFAAGGVALESAHDAAPLADDREHFGFRDSIAQPRIAEDMCRTRDDMQPAASPGLFLLGDYEDVFGGKSIGDMEPLLARNGTFCAVRVLEQHVDKFKAVLTEGAARTGLTEKAVAAKLVGRWYDGQPLSKYPDEASLKPKYPDEASLKPPMSGSEADNAFDYAPSYEHPDTFDDHAGLRCPIGAHIRRANPRTSRVAGVRHTRRLIRRGMPYERNADGRTEKGMFGMFLCASLERQFEFIQQQWLNGDLFTSGIRGTQDALAGSQTLRGEVLIPVPHAEPVRVPTQRLVTTRGSLYLFMPGIDALRRLGMADFFEESVSLQSMGVRDMLTPQVLQQIALSLYLPTGLPVRAKRTPAIGAFDPDAFDPTDRRFLADPYPTFKQFRDHKPVHWVPTHQAYWVFEHHRVKEMLTDDHELGAFAKLPVGSKDPRGVFTLDPPRHTIVRALVTDAFRLATADAADIAHARTAAALDAVADTCFDFVEHVGRRIPREVFFTILGVPASEWHAMDHEARTVMMHADRTLDPVQRFIGQAAGIQLALRLGTLLAKAWFDKKYRMLHEMAQRTHFSVGDPGPKKMSVTEAVMTLLHLVLGGYLSTEFLLCTGTRNLLLQDRQPWKWLLDGSVSVENAVEEMRRYDAPLAVVDRYTRRDVTWGSTTIPAGVRLQGMLGSANHDPNVFKSEPHRFDVQRADASNHLTMGHGLHECLGKGLQAIVVPIVFKAMRNRFPDLALVDPQVQPPWMTDPYFRSFRYLKVSAH